MKAWAALCVPTHCDPPEPGCTFDLIDGWDHFDAERGAVIVCGLHGLLAPGEVYTVDVEPGRSVLSASDVMKMRRGAAMAEDTATEVTYTGRNSPEVRAFVDAGVEWIETWFITKAMSGPTDLQAWHYVMGKAPGDPTPEGWKGARAAVYDPRTETWRPVHAGDTIVREDGGYVVRSAP